jgi:hypothetical protein
MHRRLAFALVLTLPTAAVSLLPGCKTGPYVNAHIETLNAEYRQLEDYVYALEDENSRLKQDLATAQTGRPATTSPRSQRAAPVQRTPRVTPPAGDSNLDIPSIEMPLDPANTPPRRLNRPAIELPEPMDLEPPTVELPPASEDLPKPAVPNSTKPAAPEPLQPAKPANTKVTHLFLNPVLTGGSDLDGQPGDDGLSVVIEPRSEDDQFVPQSGGVSIVVLDPTKAGDAARVARWDFAAAEVQQKLTTTSAARGIRLQMPWPATPPTSDKLHVFVRYETADGRRLQTDREIFVARAGQHSQRWTPRQGDRLPATAATAEPPLAVPPALLPIESSEPGATMPVATAAPVWSPFR